MLPAKGHKELQNNIALVNKTLSLRSAVIYGANASGKSNVWNALVKSIKYIKESAFRV